MPSLLAEHPRRVAAATFAFGLLFAGAAAIYQSERNDSSAAARFDDVVARETRDIVARMRTYEYGLRAARGVVLAAGPDRVTRELFGAYAVTRDLETEFPGARGFGFMRRLPLGAESSFVAHVRRSGSPGFAIRSMGPLSDERYVIQFVEPANRNEGAAGLDIASEPQRRLAARLAMQSGEATLTPPITLVQASKEVSRSYAFLLPVYRTGAPIRSVAEREAATVGWMVAPLVMNEIVGRFDADDARVSVSLTDVTPHATTLIYRSPAAHKPAARGLTRVVTLAVHGRTWRAELNAQPGFVSELNLRQPLVVFVRFTVLTTVLTVLLTIYAQSRDRERQVQVEQRRRGAIVESSSDAIIAQTLDGKITDWNRGAERLFGFSARDMIGRTPAEMLLPEDLQSQDEALFAQIARGESIVGFETRRLREDGTIIEVSLTASPIVDAWGTLIGVSKTVREIGAARLEARRVRDLNASLADEVVQRNAELAAAMRDNDALLRTMREHSVVSVTDRNGIIKDVNENFCQLSGYDRDALIGRSHQAISSGMMPAEFWATMWRTIASGQPWRGEICNRSRTGSLYWVDSMVIPFADANERIEKYISVQRDITKAKVAEEQLRTSERFLERAGEVAGVGGWEIDLIQGAVTWTSQTYRLHEVPDDYEPTLEGSLEFYPPDTRATLSGAIEACIRDGTGWDLEIPFITARGRQIWVRTVGTAEREDGLVVRLVGAFQDISARKEAELSLRDAMLEARKASHAKSQFLANMSHEIRTPMNAVIGLSYLMARTPLTPDQDALLGKITLASRSLLGVINDILDLTKIEADELVIERVPFDLHALLKDVSDVIAVSAEGRRIGYRMEVDPQVPEQVIGDPTRVTQVLTNLLSNAVKFTDQGQVQLHVARLASDGPGALLRFTIRDSGIGIAPDALGRLFTPFAQADESTTRRFGGTGLGLSIVKRLAELLGGEVAVQSTPGVGSEFMVSLRVGLPTGAERRPSFPARQVVSQDRLRGVRVLVADDNEINLEVALRMLELAGATVSLARDGQEAVDKVAAAPHDFDLILMDVQMPVLDGNEATIMIRRTLGLTELPILALTAGVLVTERERSIEAGMNGVISKPFEPAALIQAIRALVPATADADAGTAENSAARGAWPEVAGIDMTDVRARVSDDLELFQSLLALMIQEFPDASLPLDRSAPDWLSGHARRMHKLKGSAGALGATAIYRMAAETEGAARTGDVIRTEMLSGELTRHLWDPLESTCRHASLSIL